MRILILIFSLFLLAACAEPKTTPTTLSDGTTVHMVRCDNDWHDCYRSAHQVCGTDDFTEMDRLADETMSSAGRLERRHSIEGGIENHVYSETPRKEVIQQVLTFRCNQPGQSH